MKINVDGSILAKYNSQIKKFWKGWNDEKDSHKYEGYIEEIQEELLDDCKNIRSRVYFVKVVCGYNQKFSDEIYKCIKLMPDYSLVLKNKEYIKDIFNKNDSFGNPIKVNTFLGRHEGNNVKYLYHSMSILRHAKKLDLDHVNIIEIGGGYGGLAYFIHRMSKLYDIEISSYTIYDLKEVSQLQDTYAKHLKFPLKVAQVGVGHQIKTEGNFLVSCYAYSEITLNHKLPYIKECFPTISHGFLAWNVVPFDEDLLRGIKADEISIKMEKFGGCDLNIYF